MKIQFNTDKNIQGTEALETFVSSRINHELKYFADHITRVEVHLSDENSVKGGPDDIKCKLEARVNNKQPVLVAAKSSSKEKAIDDALDKMKATLNTVFGKMRNK